MKVFNLRHLLTTSDLSFEDLADIERIGKVEGLEKGIDYIKLYFSDVGPKTRWVQELQEQDALPKYFKHVRFTGGRAVMQFAVLLGWPEQKHFYPLSDLGQDDRVKLPSRFYAEYLLRFLLAQSGLGSLEYWINPEIRGTARKLFSAPEERSEKALFFSWYLGPYQEWVKALRAQRVDVSAFPDKRVMFDNGSFCSGPKGSFEAFHKSEVRAYRPLLTCLELEFFGF